MIDKGSNVNTDPAESQACLTIAQLIVFTSFSHIVIALIQLGVHITSDPESAPFLFMQL